MKFNFNIQKEEEINIIALEGELIDKLQTSGLILKVEEMIEAGDLKFVFNLSGLRYLNSSGLNVLINILTKSRKAGGEVIITNVSKRVNDLFLITKLNTIFTITENMENALSKLKVS